MILMRMRSGFGFHLVAVEFELVDNEIGWCWRLKITMGGVVLLKRHLLSFYLENQILHTIIPGKFGGCFKLFFPRQVWTPFIPGKFGVCFKLTNSCLLSMWFGGMNLVLSGGLVGEICEVLG